MGFEPESEPECVPQSAYELEPESQTGPAHEPEVGWSEMAVVVESMESGPEPEPGPEPAPDRGTEPRLVELIESKPEPGPAPGPELSWPEIAVEHA